MTTSAADAEKGVGIDADRSAWLRLSQAQGRGPPWVPALVAAVGGPRAAARADTDTIRRVTTPARARNAAQALRRARPERLLRRAADLAQRVLTPADHDWPGEAFAEQDDAPCCLFLRGRLPPYGARSVALVGTRDASPYGCDVAARLATDLAGRGLWVVSGFALGVDGAAHEATVGAGGSTLAVLGCGLDYDYPVAHGDLRVALLEHGGLLSEYAPGTAPRPFHFPRRNRIVAALAAVVVVVEAPRRSGAGITARLARNLGREVLAVPGSILSERHAGCHVLLGEGAGLCTGLGDILLALGLGEGEPEGGARSLRALPTGPEGTVWRALDDAEARDASAVCLQTGMAATEVAVALTRLEVSGRVRRLPGVGFLRR